MEFIVQAFCKYVNIITKCFCDYVYIRDFAQKFTYEKNAAFHHRIMRRFFLNVRSYIHHKTGHKMPNFQRLTPEV